MEELNAVFLCGYVRNNSPYNAMASCSAPDRSRNCARIYNASSAKPCNGYKDCISLSVVNASSGFPPLACEAPFQYNEIAQ